MTHSRNIDACGKMRAPLYLCPMKAIKDLANIGCQRGEDFWCIATHTHESN